uniref:alpha/beta fold hydrolase n=1 Tax=Pararhizobium sp. IMCC3301 TaxID=3067904 RepID=UPI0027414A2D|nr:alpha/beta hydrolase [Pararhizobium sp. IMCC3301]
MADVDDGDAGAQEDARPDDTDAGNDRAAAISDVPGASASEWRDVFLHAQDGIELHVRVYGEGHANIPVVCLPGLTRNAKDFHDIATFLSIEASPARKVISVDYRGRGLSQPDPDWRNYTIEQEANDLLTTLARLNVEHAHFIGTSRGGLILFALTAMRPGIMKSVVLNDIGPVVEASGLARIKSYSDNMKPQDTIEEAAAYMQTVHHRQFPALDADGWLKLARQLYVQGKKRAEPDYDKRLLKSFDYLDLSLPLPTVWPQFAALKHLPTLVLRGERSDILTRETVDQMKKAHPAMVAKTIKSEGHAPLLWDSSTQNAILQHLNRAETLASQD